MKIESTIVMSSLILSASAFAATPSLVYPSTHQGDVKDTYFETEVADPYRWLENDTTAETAAWVKAQNAVTQSYLDKIPFRVALKERLTELNDYEKVGAPFKKHGKYYFYKNDGLQNQSVLYERATLDAEPKVLLDPNTLSHDGTVALQSVKFSKDGKYLAYVISRSGSDWNEIYVMEVATRKLLKDHIVWAKFSDAQWLGDGFFYSAYDAPTDGKALSAKNENQKVYYHRLGTPQSSDRLEYQNPKFPLHFYSVNVSDDERFIYLYESDGSGNKAYVKDLKSATPKYTALNDKLDNLFLIFENIGNIAYIITNDDAPMYKIITVDLTAPARKNWKTLIPENKYVISGVQFAAGKIIITYDKDASNHAYVYTIDGKELHEIKLPALGSVAIRSDIAEQEVFYSLTSFTFPGAIYRYDINTNISTLYNAPKVKFNSDDYVTTQVEYPSTDGTIIHMFLTYKKGLKLDGNNPVFLYGYGGFNISLNPVFNSYRLPFIENGGIYAMANLRGGGEYGEDWHQAGTKLKKQNVFDDFISAAEYLIKEKYTNPSLIAINGGSNGGLLVGAVVNQRPDLFKVAVPQVGVMDMLRYHKFTIGWNWASDYGRSDDSPEMMKYLYEYSPLHTIKNDGTHYPAIMITTADHDDRVVPAHSFKYAATLQSSNTGDAPKIIRIDSKAGHGGGKPITKVIDEYADIFSFIMYNLGMDYKK
ncbi:MAG: prolyl oligopeptidase family serine peptidase [Muribaculaceae bacterium]